MLKLLLLSSVLFLAGCSSTGRIVYDRHDPVTGVTQTLTVSTPPHPTEPGSISINAEGALTASTGNEPEVTPSSRSLARLPWLGGLLLVAGVIAVALKAKLPFLPLELGAGLAISGLLLMVLPSMIEEYLGYILLGLVGTAGLITIYRLNRTAWKLKPLID